MVVEVWVPESWEGADQRGPCLAEASPETGEDQLTDLKHNYVGAAGARAQEQEQ